MAHIGDLSVLVSLDVDEAAAKRKMDELGQRLSRNSKIKLDVDASGLEQGSKTARAQIDATAAAERKAHQEGMQRLRDRNATIQLNSRLAAQAARDEAAAVQAASRVQQQADQQRKAEQQAANQAYREGMQRLREANAQAQLNSRFDRENQARAAAAGREAALQERQKQQAIKAVVDVLANETASVRSLWQAGRIAGTDLVDMQRDIQTRALAAAQAVDQQSAAYRRLTQVAAQAQRTSDQAQGRITPGGLSAGVQLGVQQSGIIQQLANTSGLGNTAQNLTIISQGYINARQAALGFGGATNTAATAAGLMTAAGSGLVLGLGAVAGGFVALGKVGLEQTNQLQRGLNVLEANGTTDLEGFVGKIKDLKDELGKVGQSFNTSELTVAAADLVKANLNSADALTVLASSTKLAAAEGTNLQETSMQLLTNIRQYGLGVDQLGRVTDMFAKAGNLAAGTVNDLSLGFGIVGTTGKNAGIEMNDLLGMLIELDNKGMSAADVGANGLRSALSSLSDITEKGRGVLNELNIAMVDASGKARPAGEIMEDLGERMRGMGIKIDQSTGELSGNGEALKVVASLMDTRAAAAVLALTGQWKDFGAQVKESTGYTTKYAETMTQGPEQAQKRLKKAFEDTGLALVKSFAGPLADFLDNVVTPGVNKIGGFIEALAQLRKERDAWGKGQAAYGAMEYNLPTWLKQSGFQAGNLLPAETKRATELLGLMQQRANQGAADASLLRNIGQNDRADAKDRETARAIGELGVRLTDLQRQIAIRQNGDNPLSAPIGPGAKDAGKLWNQEFITSLKDTFVNDPTVDSDCAIIATRILKAIGVNIKGSANAGVLANEIKNRAGTQQVSQRDAQVGDFVDFSGPGYGKVSGHHSGLVAGRDAKGRLQIIQNPGSANTQVVPFSVLPGGQANFYRVAESPYASPAAPSVGATGQGGKAADPNERLRAAIEEGKRLIRQYGLALASGNEVWVAKAGTAIENFRKGNKDAWVSLKDDFALVEKAAKKTTSEVSKLGQQYDALRARLSTSESLDKLGTNVIPQLQNIRKEALAGAEAEKKRNGETDKYRALLDLAADAASKLNTIQNRKPDQTPLEREQQTLREANAQDKLEAAIRKASKARLEAIVAGGVNKEGDLARVQAAQAELDRREELGTKRQKEAQTQAAAVNEAIRQNNVAAARAALTELERLRDTGLQKVKGNLVAELAVEKQYADLIYKAKKAVLDKERADRDADIRNSKLPEAVKTEQLTISKQTYDTALAQAATDKLTRLDTARTASGEAAAQAELDRNTQLNASTIEAMRVRTQAQEQMERAAQDALEAGENANARIIAGMQKVDAAMTTAAQNALDRAEADAERLKNRLIEIEQDTLNVQAAGNKSVADGVIADAAKLADGEDFGGALTVLQNGLDRLMTSALNGEPAAEGIDALVTAINNLTDARARWRAEEQRIAGAELALTDPLKPNPARVNGSIRDTSAPVPDGGPVAARGQRPAPRMNPDGTEYVDPGVAARDPNAAQRAADWEAVMKAERVDAYRESLKKMDLAQLEAAKSAAILAQDATRYQIIQAAITAKLEGNADATKKAEAAAQTLITAQDTLAEAMGQTKAPYADQIKSLEALRGEAGVNQVELQKLIDKFKELQGAALKNEGINKWINYAAQIGSAMQSIGGSLDGNLGANVSGFGKALGTAAGIAQDIVSQNYVGAAIKVFSTLADAIGGFQKANAQAAKQQADFNKQFTFLNGDQYSKTFTRSRGFFADLFGGGPEVVQEIDNLGLLFAKSLEGGFISGIKNGLKEALAKNDMTLFTKALKEGVGDAILEGIVDSFVQGELLKNIIGPAIKAWSDALKTTDNSADDVAALAGLDAAVQQANTLGQTFGNQVLPRLAPLRQSGYFGSDSESASSTMPTGSLFGSGPGVQLGIPRIEVALPAELTRPLADFAAVVPTFAAGATEFRAAVAEWRAFMRGSGLQTIPTTTPLRR